jgi:phage tail-like protein
MKKILSVLFLTVLANSGQTFADTKRHDPYKGFNFRVTISGKKNFAKYGFQKVTGLKVKTDVVEYREGNDTQLNPHESFGLVKYDPITMERGMSEDKDMHDLIQLNVKTDQTGGGNESDAAIDVKIELLDRARNVAKSWTLLEPKIFEYETGDFDAQNSTNVIVDRMVIRHEGWKLG